MSELVLFIGLFINSCTITGYRSIPSQTDDSPNYTSIGERTHSGGAAVSRNLLRRWGGPIEYGDYIFVESMGIYKVNDVMGATKYDKVHHKRIPIVNAIDIWCASYEEEKKIGVQTHKVYLLTRKIHGK